MCRQSAVTRWTQSVWNGFFLINLFCILLLGKTIAYCWLCILPLISILAKSRRLTKNGSNLCSGVRSMGWDPIGEMLASYYKTILIKTIILVTSAHIYYCLIFNWCFTIKLRKNFGFFYLNSSKLKSNGTILSNTHCHLKYILFFSSITSSVARAYIR